jgi:TolB-like protein/tetratricopeptide (TPR) repeat protein
MRQPGPRKRVGLVTRDKDFGLIVAHETDLPPPPGAAPCSVDVYRVGEQPVKPRDFFAELQRRNVYRVAVAYGVVSWLLVQIATQVFPFFEIPNWATRLVVIVPLLGFPVALIFAWIFELTPEGIKRTDEVEPHKSTLRSTGRKLDFVIIGVLLVVIAVFAFNAFRQPKRPELANTPEKSIAVLPFHNLSAAKADEFFTDGVQDEILINLSKLADLKVISRTSVMQYKDRAERNVREIAQQLGVSHLLEGSVERSGNRVRVRAQLIDARNDSHVWGEQYDRDLADVFAIQSEISKTIADQLEAKMSGTVRAAIERPPTSDLEAFELYERAKALWANVTDPLHAKENLPEAEQVLKEAVARDPNFMLAWCEFGKVHTTLFWLGMDHTVARLGLANAAVQTALRLQPDAGEAHLASGIYYYQGFRNYQKAREELEIARRTLPNNADLFTYLGFIDRREGNWAESTRNLERALELDPRNLFILQQLATHTYQPQRRYEDAIRTYDRALAILPGDPLTRINRAEVILDARAETKQYQTTLTALISENPSTASDVDHPDYALCERTPEAAARLLKDYPSDGLSTGYGVKCPHEYWEGVIAQWQGDSAKAAAAFSRARSELAPLAESQPDFPAAISLLGVIDAGLGRKDDALREGSRACELLPISKDALNGVALAANLALIYAWTGERNLAVEQIATIERVPNQLSYGMLKLHPYWDSLRGDPRFERIVASLAPK